LDDRNDRYSSNNKAPNLDDGVDSLSNEDASEFEIYKTVMIVNVTTEENGQLITNLWRCIHTIVCLMKMLPSLKSLKPL